MKKFLFITLLFSMIFSMVAVPVLAGENENLSGYAFATGSNYESENRVPMYAIDGVIDAESRWKPTTSVKLNEETNLYQNARLRTAWLALEFEFEVTVSSAKIYWHTECAAVGYYTLQYSSDGEEWTEIPDADYGTRTGNGSWGNPYLDEITFPAVTARFFRVESVAGETEDGLGSIYEFELYGDSAPYDFLKGEQEASGKAEQDESLSDEKPGNGNNSIIMIIVIAVGVLCVAGIVIFTLVQLKKPGKGGEQA